MQHGRFAEFDHEEPPDDRLIGLPRIVKDARDSGDTITVMERRADGIAGARRPTCLVFSTERGFIRIWEYPADWANLSDRELVEISEFRLRGQRSA